MSQHSQGELKHLLQGQSQSIIHLLKSRPSVAAPYMSSEDLNPFRFSESKLSENPAAEMEASNQSGLINFLNKESNKANKSQLNFHSEKMGKLGQAADNVKVGTANQNEQRARTKVDGFIS
mmetsp:Transcript_24278/g.37444  ORF Transcript_24278/g.37444 Transcript_24278/m.37444 type:complete len:121 (+) Transcript_24278:2759-3121(+)